MTEKRFDDIIREALGNLEVTLPPDAWTSMEAYYDIDRSMSEDSDAAFDESLRDRLKNYVPVTQSDWGAFESVVDESLEDGSLTPEQFDKIYLKNLKGHEVGYDPKTWPALEDKIDQYNRYVRRVVGIKVMEAVIFVLLLGLFHQYYPVYKDSIQEKVQKIADLVKKDAPREHAETPLLTLKSQISDLQATSTTSEDGDVLTEGLDLEVQLPLDTESLKDTRKSADIVDVNLLASADVPYLATAIKRTLPHVYLEDVLADTREVVIASPLLPTERPAEFPKFERSKQTTFSVGLVSSVDGNLINIPQNVYIDLQREEFVFQNRDFIVPGFSSGLLFTFQVERFAFESGLKFSVFEYSPSRLYRLGNTRGITDVAFDDIHFRIVRIPLHIKYDMLRFRRWTVFGSAGVSMSIIGFSSYDVTTRSGGRSFSASQVSDPLIRHVTNHFLNNGNFNENSFLTADFSIGLERILNYRWTVFTQPGFHYQFMTEGIGPNSDHINNFSLDLGVRMKISK